LNEKNKRVNHSSKSFLDNEREKEKKIVSVKNYEIVKDAKKKKQFE
jgi:hypothetical protein